MTPPMATMDPERADALREYHRSWYKKNREKINKQRKARYWAKHDKAKAKRRVVCTILKEHKQALADDPERLSTDFILKLVQGES